MNKRTIYTLPRDTEPSGPILSNLIRLHQADTAVFAKLESYVDDVPAMDRETPNDLLTIHNFAQYIVDVNVGYLLGNPVAYKAGDETDIDPVTDRYSAQSMSELDSDIAEDCAMFGQGYEVVFVDEESQVLSAKLSAYNTIVVYDDTFKHGKLFAIYYAPQLDDKGMPLKDKYDVTVWTATNILSYKLTGEQLTDDPLSAHAPHFFKEVPVVHYMNNKRMKGDYEPVITLIDAYNILQSDRVIDREKLVDAILAFYGAKLTEEDRQAIKDNRVIGLPPDAKAEYIVKTINEADTDVLRQTIAADIHKFSKTPDFTDEKFGNNPSGVSLKYKILSLEWNAQKKERQFEAGLLDRFRLYATALAIQSKMSALPDMSNIDAVFSRALPRNDFETSQMINNLEGLVDNESLISELSFVDDASASLEKAKKEKEEAAPADFATGTFVKQEQPV